MPMPQASRVRLGEIRSSLPGRIRRVPLLRLFAALNPGRASIGSSACWSGLGPAGRGRFHPGWVIGSQPQARGPLRTKGLQIALERLNTEISTAKNGHLSVARRTFLSLDRSLRLIFFAVCGLVHIPRRLLGFENGYESERRTL